MNLSSASAAFNDAANDGTIPNVDSVLHSPPRLRQSQRPKRQLAQLDPDDDDNDDQPYAKFYRSYQVDTASRRRIHSPMCISRALDADDNESASSIAFEPTNESQNLLTQRPGFILRPNVETSSYPDIKGIAYTNSKWKAEELSSHWP